MTGPAKEPPERLPGRGLGALLLLLLVFAELPLLAKHLPAGPAALVTARAVAASSAIAFLVFVFAVWPALGLRGRTGNTAAGLAVQGMLFFLVGATFVFVSARSAGAGPGEVWSAILVLAATTLVAGMLLSRPAPDSGGDRVYALVVLLICAGLPLANYALNEFGGMAGRLGYRLSPPLLVRRILLGSADSSPVPYLLLCLLVLAALSGRRLLSKGTAAATMLLLLAGTARGEEVRVAPLLGGLYVPGRPLPVLVTGTPDELTPEIQVPGVATVLGPPRSGPAVLVLPAPEDLGLVHVRVLGVEGGKVVERLEERSLDVRAVPFGWRHLASFTGVGDEFFEQAQMRSIVVSRVHPGAASLDLGPGGDVAVALLSADGVLDTDGILLPETIRQLEAAGVPVLTSATLEALEALSAKKSVLRRVWEEEGTVLSPSGLFDLFPPTSGPDPVRSRTALLILLGFSLLLFVGVRFILRRGLPAVTAVVFGLLVTGWTGFLAVKVLADPPDWKTRSITAIEGGRMVRIELMKARRACRAKGAGTMVLGRGAISEIAAGQIELPLAAHESRLSVTEQFTSPEVAGPPDVLFGPAGLRLPGGGGALPDRFPEKALSRRARAARSAGAAPP